MLRIFRYSLLLLVWRYLVNYTQAFPANGRISLLQSTAETIIHWPSAAGNATPAMKHAASTAVTCAAMCVVSHLSSFPSALTNRTSLINRLLLTLARMKKNQATGGSNSRLEPLKRLLHPFSRGRSRASSRSTSPVPGNATVDDVPSTATTSVSTLVVRSDDKPDNKLDEVQDAEQEATVKSQDQEIENSDPDAADLTRDYDAWKIAEVQLRRDEKNRKLLDAYYDILKSKLTEGLEPAGTPERRKQISTFIESESEKFQNTNSLGTIGQVLNRASNLIVASKNVVVAASAPCLPASIACAGIMLILSVSWTFKFD
jgi:hypothetical protein